MPACLLVFVLGALTAEALAEDAVPATKPVVIWGTAPLPEQASGIEQNDARSLSPVRRVSRAILFVPRWLVWGVAQPVRAGAYMYDRYRLPAVYDRTFYSKDRV